MNEQTEKLIREFAARFNTTAEHLWEMLIRQAHYEMISAFIQASFWTLLALLWACFITRKTSDSNPDKWNEDSAHFVGWLSVLVLAVIAAISISTAVSTRFNCINPEYWAVTQLRAFIK